MAVSNKSGSIIAQHVIGKNPAIIVDADGRHCRIVCYADELTYQEIMKDAAHCGIQIYRDTIDRFITSLLNPDDFTLQYASRLYSDDCILVGERIRLFYSDAELDLLKILRGYYICTRGPLEGEYIVLDTNQLDFSCRNRHYRAESMAFIVPGDVYIVIDYKYLKIYRSPVAADISNIYKEVNAAVASGTLETEFDNLLAMCADAGISIWSLMGMIDHSLIGFRKK